MKIYLARHGQTNYNDLKLCNADPTVDVHLTDLGLNQSKNLAEQLKDIPIEIIYISELRRTKQTAEIVNKYHQIEINVDPRLNDNRTGFEGKLIQDYLDALNHTANAWTVRLNGGESLEDVVKRAQSFLDYLKKTEYKTVLIVSSQVIIQYIDGIVKQVPNVVAYSLDIEKGSYIKLEL